MSQEELQQSQLEQAQGISEQMGALDDLAGDLKGEAQAQQEGLDQISKDVDDSKSSLEIGNTHLHSVRHSTRYCTAARIVASTAAFAVAGTVAGSHVEMPPVFHSLWIDLSPYLFSCHRRLETSPSTFSHNVCCESQAVEANRANQQCKCYIAIGVTLAVGVLAIIIWQMTKD